MNQNGNENHSHQTIVLKVGSGDLEVMQVFEDDFAGAAREAFYWQQEGKEVDVVQFTETTNQLQ